MIAKNISTKPPRTLDLKTILKIILKARLFCFKLKKTKPKWRMQLLFKGFFGGEI